MGTLFYGLCVLAGYCSFVARWRVKEMPDERITLSESAQQSMRSMLDQDETTTRYKGQQQLIATILLGLVLLICTVGILVLSFIGRDIPPALSAVGGTAIGALVASLNNQSKR